MWQSVEDEVEDYELVGKTSWQMPNWANGVFVTSGPSKHEMNKTKFTHVLDGFGRFSNVQFRDGQARFTSKMIKSNFYNKSLSKCGIAAGMLFSETKPRRLTSLVPGMNLFHTLKNDNNWVSMELLADNKTFVGTTDTKIKL